MQAPSAKPPAEPDPACVLPAGALPPGALAGLLRRFGLNLALLPEGTPIPGSYWGPPEAGLVGDRLHLRPDTPVHSALHEACHWICMDPARRRALHTDAGGDALEEEAVCYLQALLADALAGYDRVRLFADMDAWGYSFRAGSAAAWHATDAGAARDWLLRHDLITSGERPTWSVRLD